MNQHLNDGQLRAALDGEGDGMGLEHLASCRPCQSRQQAIQRQIQMATQNLAFLAPGKESPGLASQAAWNHFYNHTLIQKETSMFKKFIASPILRLSLTTALLITIILSIPATRALAGQLLDLFRVRQVAVVPIDITGMQQLTDNSAWGKQFSELISSSIIMTQKPGEPLEASNAAQASQLAGFDVRLPDGYAPTRLNVVNGASFTILVDRAKAQGLLNEAGRSDLVLPESLEGAEIAVNVPASVSVAYGNCPEPQTDENELRYHEESSWRQYSGCILLVEIPSPTVSAPPDVDVAQLAQIGLEFTGMTPEQAAEYTKTVDWTSTLVLPIPKNAANYEQVTVDGVTGTLIQRPVDDAPEYSLLWVKDGVIYAISGLGSDSQEAIQMANSLP